VEGRPLLERIILQAVPLSTNLEVIGENKYCNVNLSLKEKLSVSMFYNEDYLILFGDTYYTDEAIEIIRTHTKEKEKALFFGRKDGSKLTGKSYGELFAVYCPHKARRDVFSKALMIITQGNTKKNFWELYRGLHDIPLDKHEVKEDFIEINDRTEDFDFREDLEKWIQCSTA